jgi:hypothetical protein
MIVLSFTLGGLVVGACFGYIVAQVEDVARDLNRIMWGDGPRRPELLKPAYDYAEAQAWLDAHKPEDPEDDHIVRGSE